MTGFEHAITAWKHDNNHDRKHKEKRMTNLLQKMEKEVDHIYMHTHKRNPSVGKVYASLTKTWATSSHPSNALERAEDNVDRLLACCKDNPEFEPCLYWFHDIMEAAKENYSESVVADFNKNIYTKLLANDSQFYKMMKHLKGSQIAGRDSSSSIEGLLNGVLDT